MSEELQQLFPAAYEPRVTGSRGSPNASLPEGAQRLPRPRPLSTRARMILTMELRGFDKKQIAHRLQLTEMGVSHITNTDRYRAHRDHYLERMDSELLAMKPLAFTALRNGLIDSDQNTALRASEQWMKAAGFMHYGQRGAAQGGGPISAEDVAAQLLAQVNVQVNVTLPSKETQDGKDSGEQGGGG